jgi:hypothetical protein
MFVAISEGRFLRPTSRIRGGSRLMRGGRQAQEIAMLLPFTRLGPAAAAGALTILAAGSLASAQSIFRPYVGASVGAFVVSADEVDGRAVSPGIFGGVAVSRFVDVELDQVLPLSDFARSYSGLSVSFAPPGSSRAEIERLGVTTRFDKRREVTSNVSVVVVIRPSGYARIKPGLIAGVTNQHTRAVTTYTPISIPPCVDPQHPSVAAHEERFTRNLGGPTIGGQLAIAVTRHVFIVPDVRYDYGSIGDEINNALRSSVRVYWRF